MKRKTDNFNKFYNKKRNSAVKEEIRQEKKTEKKERKAAIERHFEEKRKARGFNDPAGDRSTGRPGQPAAGTPPAPGAKSTPFKGGAPHSSPDNLLPLNKYIAHSGICSRRDAAELIRQGKVMVNGQSVTEPGTKVAPSDLVKVNGKKVTISRNFVYILLNKPKDYITTTEDPEGRKTVLDLIRQATPERVFPVGRLDRNTSGVLLLTNDGDLSQKLAHPSHEIKKIYHVVLDKPLTKADFDKIIDGSIQLEDGPAIVDAIAYEDAKDKTQIGLEIHSGRNRIVRRIFEHLGYDVRGLDRVMYAGLTKKNVQRGKWRLLTEKEVRILKYLNSSIKGSAARAKEWAAAAEIAAADAKPTNQKTGSFPPKGPATPKGKPNPAKFQGEAPLIDEEGLLDPTPAPPKKKGFSPYTKRPAKGKFRKDNTGEKVDRPPFRKGDKPSFSKGEKSARPAFDRPEKSFDRPGKSFDRPGKPFDRPGKPSGRPAPSSDRPEKASGHASSSGRPPSGRPSSGRPTNSFNRPGKSSGRPSSGNPKRGRQNKKGA